MQRPPTRLDLHSDDGSLPLALLAVMIVGGLAVALVANVLMGQRTTRFDRDFTGVLHVADAGLQDAVVRLNDGNLPASFSNTIDGRTYDVTTAATSSVSWEIRSTSATNGVRRTVVAEAREVPLFFFAVFARDGIAFNGANSTDSYDRSTSTWCTGNGRAGTDEVFTFSGLASANSCHSTYKKVTVDEALLYDCDDMSPAACAASTIEGTVRCTHTGGENCQEPTLDSRDDTFKITPEEEIQRIADETAACDAAGWTDTHAGVTSSAGGVWVADDGSTISPHSGGGRDFYCVTSLTFVGDTTVSPGPGGEPVRIHVKEGTIRTVGTGTTVNCPGCSSNDYRATYPGAANLQIISLGASGFELADPQIMFAGAAYVPNAVCDGPAGADLYGSLVCGLVDNVGNWNFHYDDTLMNAGGTSIFALTDYREEQS